MTQIGTFHNNPVFETKEEELEELSLKISNKTKEISDLYMEFSQKLAKWRKNKNGA